MSISKLNSPAFKGTLLFYNPYAEKTRYNKRTEFDTDNITEIVDLPDEKMIRIKGKENNAGVVLNCTIPYKVVPPEKVMAAYTAACQRPNTKITLNYKTDDV